MKKRNLTWYKKKLRPHWSKFIRLRDADKNGICTCITCGARKHWKEMNSGHFIHGLDWVKDNEHAQCPKCNLYDSGKLDKYALFMLDTYGRERVDRLYRMKNEYVKHDKYELEELIEIYKAKVKDLE